MPFVTFKLQFPPNHSGSNHSSYPPESAPPPPRSKLDFPAIRSLLSNRRGAANRRSNNGAVTHSANGQSAHLYHHHEPQTTRRRSSLARINVVIANINRLRRGLSARIRRRNSSYVNARDFSNHEDVFDLDSLPHISPHISPPVVDHAHRGHAHSTAGSSGGVASIDVHPAPAYRSRQIERPLPVQMIESHAFVTDAAALAHGGASFEEESDDSPPYLPAATATTAAPLTTPTAPKRSPTEEQYHQTVIDHAI